MFPLTATSTSSSKRSADVPMRLPSARETRSYLSFRVLRDALSKAFNDRDAVERWRNSTSATGPENVSCPPQWHSRSTAGFPIHTDRPSVGSLFANRALPPLRPHRHPNPHLRLYPPLRPSERSPSCRQGDEDRPRRIGFQADKQPFLPISPSPLATSSSEDSHNKEWPSVIRSHSEGNLVFNIQSSHYYIREPSTVSPNTLITFMVPQTGATPPIYPASESRRRRGLRSQHALSSPENAPWIRCGWIGCGIQLAYNQRAISHHVNTMHKRRAQEMSCQWEKPGGGVCGTSMQPNHLRRHTLDIHTTLMIAWCEWCGEAQRRDVMSRHKKSCERRKSKLPK